MIPPPHSEPKDDDRPRPLGLTPEERAVVPPPSRVRARPIFRLVCVLLLAAMIPLPWTEYTGCSARGTAEVVTKTGAHLLFHHPASAVLTIAALALAVAAPFFAPALERNERLAVDVLCLAGLLLLSAFSGFVMTEPLLQRVKLLAPGAVSLVTLLAMTVDACAALARSARVAFRRRPPDDTG